MENLSLPFNSKPSTVMHLDLNSCFATIEQQANPFLRGKPVVVAAYVSPGGCILAASIEAKKLGIKTGMRVKDGQLIYPDLIVLPTDPWKYRHVHLKLRKLLQQYTSQITPKSIDEFVLNLEGYPALSKGMFNIAREIKKQIRQEIGDWLTVSIGIAPNRFLAKTASNLHKPDGLEEINSQNFAKVFLQLSLIDLWGIKRHNAVRLNAAGIYTVLDFYQADFRQLQSAFHSVLGYYWYLRLHGWEIDDVKFGRSSYGNSYALPKPLVTPAQLAPILQKLVQKMGARLRHAGYSARGVHLSIMYRDWSCWHQGLTLKEIIFDSQDIYKHAFRLLNHSPYQRPVREIAVSCFNLIKSNQPQLNIFTDILKKESLVKSVDQINERWGNFVITPARMLGTEKNVPDRIAFGGIKELEEFTLNK